MMKKIVIALLMFVSLGAFAATVLSTHIDHDKISMDESVNLTIMYPGKNQTSPDLTPLNKDFTILGSGESYQFSDFDNNGDTKIISKTIWTIALLPKHSGPLTIPSLTIGQAQTSALNITVLEKKETKQTLLKASQSAGTLFLKNSMIPDTIRADEPVLYTLKIYYLNPIENAVLIPPHVEGATVVPSGEDIRYQSEVGGHFYQVLEKHFNITPKQTGTLKVTAPILSGSIVHDDDPVDQFDNPIVKHPFKIQGQGLTLTVGPSLMKVIESNNTPTIVTPPIPPKTKITPSKNQMTATQITLQKFMTEAKAGKIDLTLLEPYEAWLVAAFFFLLWIITLIKLVYVSHMNYNEKQRGDL